MNKIEETFTAGSSKKGDKNLQPAGAEIVFFIFGAEGNWQLTIEKVFGCSGLGAQIPLTMNELSGFHVYVGIQNEFIDGFTLKQVKIGSYRFDDLRRYASFFIPSLGNKELSSLAAVIDRYHNVSRLVHVLHWGGWRSSISLSPNIYSFIVGIHQDLRPPYI